MSREAEQILAEQTLHLALTVLVQSGPHTPAIPTAHKEKKTPFCILWIFSELCFVKPAPIMSDWSYCAGS